MIFKIHSAPYLFSSINLPASKSYSIRAFFIAACGGASRIVGPSDCDDAKVALSVAKAFGAKVKKTVGGYFVQVPRALSRKKVLKMSVNESGTSLRFVLPLLPFYALKADVIGKGTLLGRPNHHLCQTLRDCGMAIKGHGPQESVPICYEEGALKAGRITIDGSVSSQFVSALMIAAPRAEQDTHLVLAGQELVSKDYVTMTELILKRSGIRIIKKSAREFLIPGRQSFKGLKNFCVPSDYGLAAFWMVASAILPSDITLKGHFDDSLIQSDGAIVTLLKKMGMPMTRGAKAIRLRGPVALKGGTFSLKHCPDLVPIMAVAAMFAQGETRLTDITHARVKESDRISDLRHELLKVGADIQEKKGELIIRPRAAYQAGKTLDPHHDHRLAMAFAILGLKVGLVVKDMECTAKSYPGFVRDFKQLVRS